MSSLTGRVFSHYHILDRIGQGGMGTVYRAHDRKADRDVAIKFISPAIAQQEVFLQRFRREVKAVAKLHHPNIVPVLDYGEQAGYAYLVMPLLEVATVLDRLKNGPLSLKLGARVMDQVSSALAHAHRQGIIHRDIKPSNILLDQGDNAMLADFGLARSHDASTSLTGSGLIGTPAYMAPEQARGGPVDARADQYALGVVLFYLATGSLPFAAETPMEYLLKHVSEPFPAARGRNPRVPRSVERVIFKATAKNPDDRFGSVSEMNHALQASIAHALDPISHQAPTIELPAAIESDQPAPRKRRWWLRIAAAAAAGLLLILAIPVFASGLLELLSRASSPAEGGLSGAELAQLTLQAGTIQAMSTELTDSQLDPQAIQTAIALTLAVGGPGEGEPSSTESSLAVAELAGSLMTPNAEIASALSQAASTATIASTPVPGQTSASGGATNTSQPPGPIRSPTPSNTGQPPPPTATSQPPGPTATGQLPTPTASYTIAPTALPTSTLTPPPTATPTQDPCPLLGLSGFGVNGKTAAWDLSNGSTTNVLIIHIELGWPAGNLELDRIRFGSSTIWNGSDDSPPSNIGSGFTGNRKLGNGSRSLKFEFTGQAEPGGYDLQLQLEPGCEISGGS